MARLIRWLFATLLIGSLVFGVSGRWDLPRLWAYVGLVAILALVSIFTVDPDLGRERRRPGAGGVDRKMRIWAAALTLGHLVLALLDVGRLHWSATVPAPLRALGLVTFAGSSALLVWAVAVNRFFSPVVRVQAERGHHVITAGPYRYVRHPGYMAMIVWLPASGLAIGSWWSLAPALAYSLLVLRRVLIEDAYLQAHLERYAAYCQEVRYRLMPGVW